MKKLSDVLDFKLMTPPSCFSQITVTDPFCLLAHPPARHLRSPRHFTLRRWKLYLSLTAWLKPVIQATLGKLAASHVQS